MKRIETSKIEERASKRSKLEQKYHYRLFNFNNSIPDSKSDLSYCPRLVEQLCNADVPLCPPSEKLEFVLIATCIKWFLADLKHCAVLQIDLTSALLASPASTFPNIVKKGNRIVCLVEGIINIINQQFEMG